MPKNTLEGEIGNSIEMRRDLTVMTDWVLILALPRRSCVTLVKLLNFFESSFHHLLNVEY